MKLQLVLGLVCGLLAGGVDAGLIEPRQAQNACQTALSKKGTSSARKDCSSFMRKTVTRCPVTTTRTVTAYRTAGTVTVRRSATRSTTRTVPTTVTIPSTRTIIQTTTIVVTRTDFFSRGATVTNKATTTVPASTETQQVTQTSQVFQPARRAPPIKVIPPRYHEDELHSFERRQNQCPSTRTNTKLPTYATACRSASAYSSACSRIGVRATATTLPASTRTVTKTLTVTRRPTRTVSTTVLKTATIRSTRTIRTTIDVQGAKKTATLTSKRSVTTTSTSVVDQVSTVTPLTTVTATTVVSVPVTCPEFVLQAVGGPSDGEYVVSQGESAMLLFNPTYANAAVFKIDSEGQLVTVDTNLIANSDDRDIFYIYLESQQTITDNDFPPLICEKTPLLSCQTRNGQNQFAVCPIAGPGEPGPGPALLFGTGTTRDCSQIKLRTLPGPNCPAS